VGMDHIPLPSLLSYLKLGLCLHFHEILVYKYMLLNKNVVGFYQLFCRLNDFKCLIARPDIGK
jgi:hypothetical protein